MNKKLVVVGIVVLLLAVGLSGCIFEDEENKLLITELGKEGSIVGDDFLWTITITVANRGSNAVIGAELVINLYSGDRIVDSESVSLGTMKSDWASTQSHLLIERDFATGDTHKVIATIYLGDEVLDTQSMTW